MSIRIPPAHETDLARCSPHDRTSKLSPQPKDVKHRPTLDEQKTTDAPVGRSEAWNALSACSFFSFAVSSFFSCPTDPPNELIRGQNNIRLFEPVPWDVRGRGKGRQGNETGKGWLFIEIRISDTGNAQCWIWQSGLGTGSFSSAPSHSRLTHYQTMLSTVLGFSAFGFAARVGQLAIQKRPLFSSEPSRDLLVTTRN